MIALLDAVRTRLLPAIVTALGVVIVTAGLLSYVDPAAAGSTVAEPAIIETAAPADAPPATVSAPSASATPGSSTDASAGPSTPAERAVATRLVVPALRIDLAVVKGNAGYPYCNVAMYYKEMGQPGENRATYIYAHARDGMFGPIYELAIQQHNAKKMLGMIVQVYTSDNKLYLYEIREYRLHALTLDGPLAAPGEELWLQTSEGPKGTPGKTQLRALLLSVGTADAKDAHPKAKPLVCG